jgi:Flp pilus assembly protein TadD
VDALTESVALIEGVVKSSEYAQSSKAWLAYGNVYAEHVNRQTEALVLHPDAPLPGHAAVSKTFKGYQNALKYAEKGYEKKDALSGLSAIEANMYYQANVILNRQDYAAAFPAYYSVVQAEELLEENGEEGIFTEAGELQNAKFVTAVCAFSAEKTQDAVDLLEKLRAQDYQDAGVYEYLYKAYSALEQEDKAEEALEAGRMKFPGDKGLLFAEINATLAKGNLEELVNKLKLAMEAEPGNISVPTTLGNVYDQLYQQALADGDIEKAHDHFNNAKFYIQKALDIDAQHFDAVYMMGALEYNRAAELATEMNALADDYTKEGTKKYQVKQAEMLAQFDKALPYFEQAELLNPEDTNTLLALREIWARKNDLEKSNAYKAKLDAILGN